jgi:predicted TIM-barrel fold metal-dependent hydrolase
MVRRCLDEWGSAGVKMNGAQNGYYIDDPEIGMPVAEAIAKGGAMIAFHIGPDAHERTHPHRAERIASRFPETTVLMVHIGMTNWDMHRAVLEAAERCPNMVLVAGATSDNAALAAIRRLGAGRVCFGSDRPFRKPSVVKAMFETSFRDELSEEEMSAFMGGNMIRLLQRAPG